jgi:hypothetical protein
VLAEETRPVAMGEGEFKVCTTTVVEVSGGITSVVVGSKLDVNCEVSEVTRVEELLELREEDGAAL